MSTGKKKKNKFIVCLFFITAAFINISAQESELHIKYIGNMGVLISSEDSKILIDALHQGNPWGYGEPSEETITNIINHKNEFADVNIFFATHRHIDHFNNKFVYEFLKNGKCKTVLTQQAVDDIKNNYKDFERIKSLITVTDNSENGIINFKHENIAVKAMNISHGNTTQNTGYLIELGGFKILHAGDAAQEPKNFTKYNIAKENIDVAFLPLWFLDEEELLNAVNAKQVIFVHVSKDEIGKYDNLLKKNQIIFTKLNDEFVYKKK
ncbi:MAG: hypothetical protein A2068_10325 [Ignavibacteria bacterium GWB2_35_6b]|nr:MAG: hypothetical protein A2068_10325 [Ignavibacteria bacterium GWB2_35_6b]